MSMLDEIIANVTMDGVAPLNKKAAKQIATIYAEAVAQDALKRASEEAQVKSLEDDSHYVYEWIVDEQSILNVKINLL